MISSLTIQEVKDRMDVVEVVKDHVKLKKQGANYVGLCPFHDEKTPSFTVSPAKQIYKCFGCGKSGDAIQFLVDQKHTFNEAIEKLAEKYNIQFEQSGKKKEYVRPLPRLEKVSKEIIEWFETRGISNDTLLRMKVSESREWFPQLKQESPSICFNYFRNEELVNIKHRGKKKSFKLEKDAELIFFNLDAIKGEKEGIIVEGEIDTLTGVECGIYNIIGVPNGTPPAGSKLNLEYLDNCWKEIDALESVIIAVDNDTVGNFLKEELGRRIGKEKCKVVVYPDGCKDPNEILTKHGKQAVKDFFSSARSWPLEGITPMEEMVEDIINYYENGYPPGEAAGVGGFDEYLTFFPGHLTMITGVPGHGKDEFSNLLMTSLSKNKGWKWGVFNFEEPATIHSTKLMEKFAGKSFAFRKDQNNRMSTREMEMALAMVDQHFHFVNVSKVDVTMEGILKLAVEMVKKFGINGIIINPWNYLEHKKGIGQSETDYVSEALTMLCNFLWKHGVHCFLVAHPTKMMKDKKTGLYEVPTLYSISGSAHFFNKTHNGLCVYRNPDGTTDIHIQKVKWYWLGKTGLARFFFNTQTREYSPMELDTVPPAELGAGNWKQIDSLNNLKTNDDEQTEDIEEDLPF